MRGETLAVSDRSIFEMEEVCARSFSRMAALPHLLYASGISITGFKKIFLPIDGLQSRVEIAAPAAQIIELFLKCCRINSDYEFHFRSCEPAVTL